MSEASNRPAASIAPGRRFTQFAGQFLRSPQFLWPAGLIGLTVLLYGRAIGFEFVNFDDDAHVYQNPDVLGGLSWSGLTWDFAIHGPSQWHPLAWISHQLDWQLFGPNPAGHHAVNIALHVCGVVLSYFAMHSLLGRFTPAGYIAAMFAVHPLNLESVAWISERRNVLCGVFWMSALISYARYARQGGLIRYGWVTFWVALALMSKPLAVTLPCVFLLLDYWPLRRYFVLESEHSTVDNSLFEACPQRGVIHLLLEKLPWLMLSAGAGWLSYLCQQQIQVVSDLGSLPWRLRLENACVAYGLYLRRMVWPVDLAVFYPHPAWNHQDPEQVLLVPAICSGTVLFLVTVSVLWCIRRQPGLAVGWFWFLGTLVPMIGLVQVGRQQLADRYAYVPMIGLGLMVVTWNWPSRLSRRRHLLGTISIVCWFSISIWQLGYWRDSEALFRRAIQVTSNNSWAHHNLGFALQSKGNAAEAIKNYEEALSIDPAYALAHYNLGIAWQGLGRLELAIQHLEQAVLLEPGSANSWIRLGGARGQAGQLAKAEQCFRQALELDKHSAQARFNLALVLQARGDQPAALIEFQRSVEQAPDSIDFRAGWMRALAQAGRMSDARNQAQEILQRNPESASARAFLLNRPEHITP